MDRSPGATARSSLALLNIPWVHSQVELLTTSKFLTEAKKFGLTVDREALQHLNQLGLLVPLYRIDDEPITGRVVDVPEVDYSSIAMYAREGKVRDPEVEGMSVWWPHDRPDDAPDNWWDGYLYSKWQLLGVEHAINSRTFAKWGHALSDLRRDASSNRREHMALAALSSRHFGSIVGQLKFRDGAESTSFRNARLGVDDAARLEAADYPAENLQRLAEYLLSSAKHSDPMGDWWPVVRHSDHSGWFKLKGRSLLCLWQRLAAEVLLRAHEELAEVGLLEPIPDLEINAQFWSPLHERITVRGDAAEGLDRALGALGVSPHPRVVLVVEGQTEQLHVEMLLQEWGIAEPNRVRLVVQGTSSTRPTELARYVSPKVGPARAGRRPLLATPTALFVAMDPEGPWATEETRANERRKLQRALREDVEAQGAVISQDELDVLIQVFSWGDHKYELANFADADLLGAIEQIAIHQGTQVNAAWTTRLSESLRLARSGHRDIKTVFDRMGLRQEKVALARLLEPALLRGAELSVNLRSEERMPVLQMMDQIHGLVQQLSGGGYTLDNAAG